MPIETLCDNEFVSLRRISVPDAGVHGYVYSHESRSAGRIVSILPYRVERAPGGPVDSSARVEFLLRHEVTPCWGSIHEPQVSSITGGWESDDDVTCYLTAQRELWEEAGYAVRLGDLLDLGACRGTKSSDTIYFLFAVDLTGAEQTGSAEGDGSELERLATNRWSSREELVSTCVDPLAFVTLARLEAHHRGGFDVVVAETGTPER